MNIKTHTKYAFGMWSMSSTFDTKTDVKETNKEFLVMNLFLFPCGSVLTPS